MAIAATNKVPTAIDNMHWGCRAVGWHAVESSPHRPTCTGPAECSQTLARSLAAGALRAWLGRHHRAASTDPQRRSLQVPVRIASTQTDPNPNNNHHPSHQQADNSYKTVAISSSQHHHHRPLQVPSQKKIHPRKFDISLPGAALTSRRPKVHHTLHSSITTMCGNPSWGSQR